MFLPKGYLLQEGKYQVIRHISSGGFGNTYEAYFKMLDCRVAIKEFFMKDFCNRDETTSGVTVAAQSKAELVKKLQKKFNDEAKAIYSMNHDHIVRVLDIFEENCTSYYVMDYVEGESLNEILKKNGPLPEIEAIGYIRQVADALKYIHSKNRLHLDIKPGNIMIDKSGKAVLIDFGASKHYDDETGENTSTLMGVNTRGYAPIEQSTQSFTTFSPATDIYALGATLYKLLTGIVPSDSVGRADEDDLQPLPVSISEPTRNAVSAALQIKRKDRPQSIDNFIAILDNHRTSSPAEESTIIEHNIKDERGQGTKGKDQVLSVKSNSIKKGEPSVSRETEKVDSSTQTLKQQKKTKPYGNIGMDRKKAFSLCIVACLLSCVSSVIESHFGHEMLTCLCLDTIAIVLEIILWFSAFKLLKNKANLANGLKTLFTCLAFFWVLSSIISFLDQYFKWDIKETPLIVNVIWIIFLIVWLVKLIKTYEGALRKYVIVNAIIALVYFWELVDDRLSTVLCVLWCGCDLLSYYFLANAMVESDESN